MKNIKKLQMRYSFKLSIRMAMVIISIVLLFLLGCGPQIGLFPESNFLLSPDSRLPKWFTIPPSSPHPYFKLVHFAYFSFGKVNRFRNPSFKITFIMNYVTK